MARRYQPSLISQPGTSDAQESTAAQLVGALSSFRQEMTGMAVARQSRRGAAQGLKDTLAGQGGRKRGIRSMTAYGAAYNTAAVQADVALRQIDIESSYERFELEANGDEAAFTALSQGYAKGLLQTTPPDVADDVDLLIRSRHAEGAGRVHEQFVLRERERQRTDILTGLDSMVESAGRKMAMPGAETDEALLVLQDNIQTALAAGESEGLFTPAQVRQLRGDYVERIATGVSEGQVRNAVAGIMGRYEADVLAGDQALADLPKLGLDAETEVKVRERIEARLNLLQAERKRAHAVELGALHQDIADGTPSENAEDEAFRLYRQSAMEVGGFTSMLSQIEGARVKGAESAAEIESAALAFNNSTPLDPKNSDARKAMDALYKQQVAGVPRGTPEYQNLAIEMARRTNIIPTDAISWARTVVTAGDPDSAVQASNFLRRMEDANPASFQYVDDAKLLAFTEQVNAATAAGTPPDLAVQVAQRNTFEVTEAERSALNTTYRTAKIADGNAGELQSFLDGDDRYDRSLFHGAPQAPMALQAEFDAAVERYYPYSGGDAERARALAWRDTQRVWGYTTVNGAPELMKYAPEVMFPGLTPEVIRSDVAASVPASPDARLIPMGETARTGGRVWHLGKVNEYGAVDVILDEHNRPQRYELPISQEAFDAVHTRLAAEKVAAARVASRERRLNLEAMRQSGGDPIAFNEILSKLQAEEAVKQRTGRGF